MKLLTKLPFLSIISILICLANTINAQDNYEIQVYSAPTVEKNSTMVELHSNYTLNGSKTTDQYGMLPTNHILHETIEITHGWNSWFETGFYFFNAIGSHGRTNYVGSHIRPRVAIPESFNWPFGLSLSVEYGFQKKSYSPDTRTLEIRPIIDKYFFNKRLYFAFNPAFDKSFAGPSRSLGYVFSPNAKIGIDISKKVNVGLEYYGTIGPLFQILPYAEQQQQLFVATDIDFGPRWEFNAGLGYGLSPGSDKLIFKTILGRRFGGK